MGNIVVSNYKQNRALWLEKRRTSIGSSDAPTVCGLNPFKSRVGLWLEKTGMLDPVEPTAEAVRWGNILEQDILEEFHERTGIEIAEGKDMLRHPSIDFLTASPDGWVKEAGELGLGEIKTTNERNAWLWSDGIPDYAHTQISHQMLVTGATFGYVVCLIGGQKMVWYRVERDERLMQALHNAEIEFWRMVKDRIRPELRHDDLEAVQRLYSKADESVVALSCEDKLIEMQRVKKEISALEKISDKLEADIKWAMGKAEKGICGNFQISWKNVSSSRVDTKLLKERFPDIAASVSKVSESRRFLLKEIPQTDPNNNQPDEVKHGENE